jgi:hypothetical protein
MPWHPAHTSGSLDSYLFKYVPNLQFGYRCAVVEESLQRLATKFHSNEDLPNRLMLVVKLLNPHVKKLHRTGTRTGHTAHDLALKQRSLERSIREG